MGDVRRMGWVLAGMMVGGAAWGAHLEAQPRSTSGAPAPTPGSALTAAGIDERSAVNSVVATLQHGMPQFHFAIDRFRNDETARLALLRGVGPVLPELVDSQAFATAYSYLRRDAERAELGEPPRDPAMVRADAIHELSLATIDLRRELSRPGVTSARRADLERQLATARQALTAAQQEANDPAVVAADQATFTAASADYETRRAAAQSALDRAVPLDPRQLVADRLGEFVAGCRDVNFRARTVTEGGVTRFAAPADEARPRIWKLCYRAGQRSTQEARRLATNWLTRLSRAGIRPRSAG